MYTLYSMQRSGNSYKVRLALARLGIPYKLVEVDILKGDSRTPEFLAKNPNGQVPLLEVAPDRHLAESNAILWYVAGGSMLAPEDRIGRAEALQWMFFEQHSLEPNIGAAYFWLALIKGGRELQSHDRGIGTRCSVSCCVPCVAPFCGPAGSGRRDRIFLADRIRPASPLRTRL